MAITYQDFLETVVQEDKEFVNSLDTLLENNNCKTEIKEAKNGYVATYFYIKDKKKISFMNYVFRKDGMRTRIYARHVGYFQSFLDTLPEEMKKDIVKAGICKKISGISECSPTCTGGYEFAMDGEPYKKCKNMAFFFRVCQENKSYIEQFIENELKYI